VRDLGLRELAKEAEGDLFPKLAVYGQVGRDDLPLPWESTDRADALR
jgi:S-adenosylmethionine synthetase